MALWRREEEEGGVSARGGVKDHDRIHAYLRNPKGA